MRKFPSLSKFPKPVCRRQLRFAAESLEQRALLSAFVSEFPSPTTADAAFSAVDAQTRDQSAACSETDCVLDLENDHDDNHGDDGHEAECSARDGVPDLENDHGDDHDDNHGDAGHEDERSARDREPDLENDHGDDHDDNHGDAGHEDERSARDREPDLENDHDDNHDDNHGDAGHEDERSARDREPDLENDHDDNHADAGHEDERSVSDPLPDLTSDDAHNDGGAGHEIGVVEIPEAVVVAVSSHLLGATIEAAERVTTRTPSAQTVSLASVSLKGPQTAQDDDRPANNAAGPRPRDAADINAAADEKHFDRTDTTCLAAVCDTTGTTPQVMNISLTNATSATRLPLMARLLTDVLPQDLASIERGLQEFLNGVNSLTDMSGEDSAARRWLPSLVTAAVALYGAQQLISERRKSTRNPVLTAASQSSWSWVMNLSTSSDSKEQ